MTWPLSYPVERLEGGRRRPPIRPAST